MNVYCVLGSDISLSTWAQAIEDMSLGHLEAEPGVVGLKYNNPVHLRFYLK